LDPTAGDGHPQPAEVTQVVVHQTVRRGCHVARLAAYREAAAVHCDEVVACARGDRVCREMQPRHPTTVHNEPSTMHIAGRTRHIFRRPWVLTPWGVRSFPPDRVARGEGIAR